MILSGNFDVEKPLLAIPDRTFSEQPQLFNSFLCRCSWSGSLIPTPTATITVTIAHENQLKRITINHSHNSKSLRCGISILKSRDTIMDLIGVHLNLVKHLVTTFSQQISVHHCIIFVLLFCKVVADVELKLRKYMLPVVFQKMTVSIQY